MHRLLFGLVLSLASGILLSGCAGFPFLRETRITFLHINDIYEMAPREGQGGGLARVKTLVDREKKANPNTLLIVSGDILSPSLISSLDQGSSMIEAMNIIGADFAGLGNHDFDFGLGPLRKRIVQSQFKWVATNILEDGGQITGTVVVAMKNIKGVKVGFIGLMDPKILDSFNTPKG
ncbi:MAG: metallophosphoesterase, partial [Nitrospinota bacterium]|nr:metallophosphoesterase [Nitrospinota bacterium]